MIALVLLLAGCDSDVAPGDAPSEWAGTFRSQSGCTDGDVTMDVTVTGGRVEGVYTFERNEPGEPSSRATYRVSGTRADGVWTLAQEDILHADEIFGRWCHGVFTLTEHEGASGFGDRVRWLLQGMPAGGWWLDGTWVAADCGCAGTMVVEAR